MYEEIEVIGSTKKQFEASCHGILSIVAQQLPLKIKQQSAVVVMFDAL